MWGVECRVWGAGVVEPGEGTPPSSGRFVSCYLMAMKLTTQNRLTRNMKAFVKSNSSPEDE